MQNTKDLLAAVQIYLDAIHECDVSKLDLVFHPQSSLFDGDTGEVFVEPIASFKDDVAGRSSPAARGQKRVEEVINIDWLSHLSATVKVRLQAHDSIFVDHLAFVKGKDSWRIVSKVWHLEGTAEVALI